MINKRLIPVLLPFLLFLGHELFLFNPKSVFVVSGLSVILIFFASAILGRHKKNLYYLVFASFASVFYLSFFLYLSLLSSRLAIQSLMIVFAGMIFYYFKNLYYYFVADDLVKLDKIENFSVAIGTLSSFAIFTSIYTLPLFVRLDINLMLLISLPFILFLFFKPLFLSPYPLKERLLFVFISGLIMAQMSWLFSFLPLASHVLGLLTSLIYYLLLIVARLSFKGSLNRQNLKWPIALVSAAVVTLLLSSRWL